MRKGLAVVILNVIDDTRKVLPPSYQSAILLRKMKRRKLGTVVSIHHHNVLDDSGQFDFSRCVVASKPGQAGH
jgi:hypothetical protein